MIFYNKKNNAFTLIEVLIALVILAIALVAIIKAVGDNARTSSKIKDITIANWVGNDVIKNIQFGKYFQKRAFWAGFGGILFGRWI